jgi:hypothetical protein
MNPISTKNMTNTVLDGYNKAKVRVDRYTNVPTMVLGGTKYYGFRVGRVPRRFNDDSNKVAYSWFSYKGYIFVDASCVGRSDLNLALDKVY